MLSILRQNCRDYVNLVEITSILSRLRQSCQY